LVEEPFSNGISSSMVGSRMTTYVAQVIIMMITYADQSIIPIFLHQVREQLKLGNSVKYVVPDSVISYIREHKLYDVTHD
jgi:nicotinic acid mononucleotide adenylyltransferase